MFHFIMSRRQHFAVGAMCLLWMGFQAAAAAASGAGRHRTKDGRIALEEKPAPAHWLHPTGLYSREMIAEMRRKCARYEWARKVRDDLEASVEPWVKIPMERLWELIPKKRTNVYHNFSCPEDRSPLKFDPFNDKSFTCPKCGRVYPPDGDPKVYPEGHIYHATFYDGWGCHFLLAISDVTHRLGLAYAITGERRYAERGAQILLRFADLTPQMKRETVGGYRLIFTYHREGDNQLLLHFAVAYELLRGSGALSEEQKHHIERDFLKPFCDDVVLDPEYLIDANNVYYWLMTAMLTGIALEDRHYLDFAFGLGEYSPEKKPLHRSLSYIARHHFKPDGAYWELCSGYHLYPLNPLLRIILLGRNLSRQEPGRFKPEEFDLTHPQHPAGDVARRALKWYTSLSLPDYTMSMLGDAPKSWDSLKEYDPCAEIGYRYFGIDEAAYYPSMEVNRGLWGLVYGASRIVRRPVSFQSSRLSSGFAALRSEFRGKKVYAGISYLLPGGMHQHADRLELITYACDRLLGMEKGNPYNDMNLLEAGRKSYSHNTVTVDKTSQKEGEDLKGDEIPYARYFQSNPEIQLVEVWGDHLYPQAPRYRRTVALIDDITVDIFQAAGGKTQDWIYHCDGEKLDFDLPMQAGRDFDPPVYVAGGSPDYTSARTGSAWSANWTIDPFPDSPYPGRRRTVHHRLTMLGGAGTKVFHLKTYPAMKKAHALEGVMNTVLARRTDNTTPFVSVLDTYFDRPGLISVEALPCDVPGAVALKLEAGRGARLLLLNPEPDRVLTVSSSKHGISLKGHLALFRLTARGEVAAAVLLDGSRLSYDTFCIETGERANLYIVRKSDGSYSAAATPDLAYETLYGKPVYTASSDVRVSLMSREKEQAIMAKGQKASPGHRSARPIREEKMETITQEGTTWTASTWAYNTPKLLYDGKNACAVSLAGEGPGKDMAVLFWRDDQGWHKGAEISPVYQPATILLDHQGHINLFCTDRGQRGYHWRSVRPGDVREFEQVPLLEPEKFGYGYLGAARNGTGLILVGLDNTYAMWLAVKPSVSAPWGKPHPLAPSQREQAPHIVPLYPVVMPQGEKVHVVYSNCPDGGVHNTYNRVEYALFDLKQEQAVKREMIAEGPVGEMTYGLDALRSADGTLYVLYMAGVYSYGNKREDIEERRGLYCAVLRPGGSWEIHRVTTSTGTGQLYLSPGGVLNVFESTSAGTRRYSSTDGGKTWGPPGGEIAWDSIGYFLYILKPTSGSHQDNRLRAVQSQPLPEGKARYGLQYIEMDFGG